MSDFGAWIERDGLRAFSCAAAYAPGVEREGALASPQALLVGNRCVQLYACNDGTVGLWDERFGGRWLTSPEPSGTGVSVVMESDGATWGTAHADWPGGRATRTFGPAWFEVACEREGLRIERLLLCPEGEAPWVLVRVRLTNTSDRARRVRHVERWRVSPLFLNLTVRAADRFEHAKAVRYRVEAASGRIVAHEARTAEARALEQQRLAQIFGPAIDVVLEALGGQAAVASDDGAEHPTLELASEIEIAPGATETLWFRFGADDDATIADPAAVVETTIAALHARLPRGSAAIAAEAVREIPWHAAILSGGACRDEVVGGHALDQGSAYSYRMGFNGAARDPLQHALPLVYSEPDLALSVLRNTCSWATPEGDMPYALDGAKQPWTQFFSPSDQNLWALWLAAEYAAATGDLAAFEASLAYHPAYGAGDVSLKENLRRQFTYFVEEVGTGEHGHVRIRNADWNDAAIALSGVNRRDMIEKGESILNSAFAAWALPVYAGLCDRLGDGETAARARAYGETLRKRVADEWNGRWYRRAYAPGAGPLGDESCWLEVQPWAILCGAADDGRARELLANIDETLRQGSPLGARVRWPVPESGDVMGKQGEGTAGGVWFSINMTLAWAAARLAPELAWDEWRKMSLAAHTRAYPGLWEGTLSGPDAYNGPESPRAGGSWHTPVISMQQFPVNNMHSHSAPLLTYLRLLGVEPAIDGALLVRGSGGSFASRTFRVDADGHGRLTALGLVTVRSAHGEVRAGPGEVTW